MPAFKVLVEIEGGAFLYGRHNRPGGMFGDMEKYNRAVTLGWHLLRYATIQQIREWFPVDLLELEKQYNFVYKREFEKKDLTSVK